MTTGDNLLYRSKAKGPAESTAAHWMPSECPSELSCLLAALRLFPVPEGSLLSPSGTRALNESNHTSPICHFESSKLSVLIYLPAIYVFWRRSGRNGGDHACECPCFLCGSEPSIALTQKVLTSVMQTACGTKNKTHTDESRHVKR